MKTVLVTGATGCVGSNLTLRLREQGYAVRAFHPSASSTLTLRGIDVEHRHGDIRDKDALRAAMTGCDTVFHTAAIVAFWKKRHREQMEVNVSGTRNVVELCLELGVGKLVHTSSVAALGHRSDDGVIDESVAYNWKQAPGYRYSKYISELEVLRGVRNGLDATIVNPSVIVGPRDPRFHGGQIVRDVARGRIRAYVEGGMNIVSVHDVVTGHLLAAERGKSGERYILGGENMSYKEIFERTARVLGVRPPSIKLPLWLVRALARGLDVAGTLTGWKPWISSELIASIGTNNWYSHEKARRELNYVPTSLEQAIRDTYVWYKENNLL